MTALALGDLDGDSRAELVVGTSAATLLFRNDGAGLFSAHTGVSLGTSARAIVIGTVDGAAGADVLVASGTTVTLYSNLGSSGATGLWLGVGAGSAVSGTWTATQVLALGDVNADGKLDLFVGSGATGVADALLLGAGDGTFTAGTVPGTSGTTSAVLVDIDGNGTLDLVRTTGTGVQVALNPGGTWSGFSAAVTVVATGAVVAVGSGRVDAGTTADLVTIDGTGPAEWRAAKGSGPLATSFQTATAIGVISITLPAGPYLKVTGNPVTITVGDLSLVGDISITQETQAGGARVTTVAVTSMALDLGAGIGTVTLSGSMVVGPGGLAARLTVGTALSFGAGVDLIGSFHLDVNTGTAAVVVPDGLGTHRVPAGPYVQVVADLTMTFGTSGPRLVASVSIRTSSGAGGARTTVIALSDGRLTIPSLQAADPILTGVNGILVLTPDGLAGTVRGTLDLKPGTLPAGVALTGTFGLAINRTTREVRESVTFDGATVSMVLPAGPYLRVSGDNVSLTVAGQTLTGNIALEQSGTAASPVTVIAFSGVTLALGDGTTELVRLENARGAFVLTGGAVSGSLIGRIVVSIPQVSLSGDIRLEVNTGGPVRFAIGGENLELSVGGQTIAGTFWFEQVTTGTTRTVKVTVTGASLFLGDDKGTEVTTDDVGFRLAIPSGAFLVTPTGMAGRITATLGTDELDRLPFTLGTLSATLELNTMPTRAVDAGLGLDLPAGRFLRVTMTTSLTVAGQSIAGTFMVEQVSSAGADRVLNTTDDVKILKVAAINVSLFLGAPGLDVDGDPLTVIDGDEIGLSVTNGTALFLVTPQGLAGRVSATASLLLGEGITPVTATVVVEVNQLRRTVGAKVMPVAVDEQFVVDGQVLTLALPAGPFVSASLTGLALVIGGQRFTADLRVESRTRLATDGSIPAVEVPDLTVAVSNLGLRLGSPERDVVVVSNGSGTLKIIGATAGVKGGVVGRVVATVAVDVPGVVFSGTFDVRLNTTLTNQPLQIAGATTPETTDDVIVTVERGVLVSGTGVSLDVAGQRLTGSFTFKKNATTGVVTIGLKNVSLALGNGTTTFVTVGITTGAIMIVPATAGAAGGIAAKIAVTLTLAPSLASDITVADATAELLINTTTRAISTSVDVDGSPIPLIAPAGPYVRVTVGVGAPVAVTIKNQSLTASVVFEQRTTSAGTKVVRIAFTQVGLFLGDPGRGVRLSNGSGAVILTAGGIAGEVEGTVALEGLPVSITATLKLQVNNLGVPVAEIVQFAGLDAVTDTQGTASVREVQRLLVTATSGTYTLAYDRNGNGRIETTEVSGPLAVAATAAQVETALEALTGHALTVAAVTGGFSVTWDAVGNRAQVLGNVRVLALPTGPYLRIAADGIDIRIFKNGVDATGGTIVIRADVAFERVGPTGSQLTKIAFANASVTGGQGISGPGGAEGITSASGALIIFPPNSVTVPASAGPPTVTEVRTTTGGIAGVITGRVDIPVGGASVGLGVNTTGVQVKQSVSVGTGSVSIDLAPGISFLVQDLDFSFGDILEIRAGSFSINGTTFSGSGLEIFIGKGPSKRADGSLNPAAVGILVTNATMAFRNVPGVGFALRVTGTLSLVGLDGLTVSGSVTFEANTTTSDQSVPGHTPVLAAGTYRFTATNARFAVAGIFELTGTLGLTRSPSGDLDISLANAGLLIGIGGRDVARLTGFGAFSISPVTGFRLVNFKVTDFKLFPKAGDPALAAGTTATLFPTADLVTPLRNAVVTPGQLGGTITVIFNDPNGVGLRPETITDTDAEIQLLAGGVAIAGVTVSGVPTLVSGTTYRYTYTGTLPQGLVTVRFLNGGFSDRSGAMLMGEDESFLVFQPTLAQPKPGPYATLASPSNGGSITAAQINAQRYLDITWTSLPPADGVAPEPIRTSSIESATVAPFVVTGPLGDLALSGGRPVLVGTPLLISGRADTATTVTYRYFLKDSLPANTVGLFLPGVVTLTFDGGVVQSGTAAGTYASNASGQTQSFTIDASAPGAATTGGPVSLGPLTLQGPSIGLADFGFAGGMVVLTIAVGVDRASLAFGGSATTTTTGPSATQTSSGVTVDLVGVLGTFDLAVDVLGLLSGNVRVEPTGKWNLRVASLTAVIPNVASLSATGIVVGYDPNGGDTQRLIVVNTADITFPRLGITGRLRPYDPTSGRNVDEGVDGTIAAGITPGLVIRPNGFSLGTAELAYGLPLGADGRPVDPSNAVTPTASDGKITFGGVLELDDIRIGVSGLTVTFGTDPFASFTGEIYIATGGARLFPGKAFGATLTDRQTADDRRPDGSIDDEAFRATLTFTNGVVDSFELVVDTLEIRLGTFVTLTSVNFRLDTGAIGTSAEMVSFTSVGAKVTVGGLSLTGEGRNFAITGDGSFKAKTGFGVFLAIGSSTGSSFAWPEFLPIRIDAIGIQWDDIEDHPEDFVLTLSASVTEIKGISGLTFSGSIQGIKIAPALLAEGKFPIIGLDSIAVRVSGKMFGGELTAGLIGGILKLDSTYAIIGALDTTTPVFKRVFYLGLEGGFSIAGMAGFTIRLGLSELGPLQVFINVEVPGGLVIFPPIGLALNDFAAGVEFFKTLPSIEDPLALRGPDFALPTDISAATWLTSLQNQVALQAKSIAANPDRDGFFAAFTSPMVITGSAKIYTIFTSQQVFNGQVTVKISTDGKLLIIGKLNFAADNLSISGRLYADLSRVATGNATLLFLADIPDQIRLLTIYGKIKMGFRDSSGNEVTFDVVNLPDPVATGTTPTVDSVTPAAGGGRVDAGVINRPGTKYVDVVFTAPNGAALDLASILDNDAEFDIIFNDNTATVRTVTSGRPVPIVTITLDDGVLFAPLVLTGDRVTYTYRKPGDTSDTVVVVVDASDESLTGSPDLMALAVARTGTTRFRYEIGTADVPIGTMTLRFGPGTFKNADTRAADGTAVTGALSAAKSVTFRVTAATATVTSPAPGASVDVNTLNGRNWIDVAFTPPAGFTIDLASIRDLAPEFSLSGPGLGSIRLDTTQAPTLLPSGLFRYWLVGRFAATGTVTLTYLPNAWSYSLSLTGSLATITVPDPGTTTPSSVITITLPAGGSLSVPADFTVDAASVLAGGWLNTLTFAATNGWTFTVDPSRSVQQGPSANQFLIPVVVVKGTGGTTVTPTLTAAPLSYGGPTGTGTQPGATAPVTIAARQGSYVDVQFRPSLGGLTPFVLDLGTLGDEISFAGFGGTGITLVPGGVTDLGGGLYRFGLSGTFRPGQVDVILHLDKFGDNSARAPPVGSTETQSFLVTGSTGDVVSTTPGTGTTPEKVVGLSGSAIGRDLINGRHYLEITFRPSEGFSLDHGTIDGGEIELRGPGGALIALASPVRVGLTNTYRYAFVADLAIGKHTVAFVAGSFGDTGGTLNLAESESFTVATPIAALADPIRGQVIDAKDFNGRGYVDITFAAFHDNVVAAATILDSGAEITVTAGGKALTVLGTPLLVSGSTYRYFFTGHASGALVVTFIDGSWANTGGIAWSSQAQTIGGVVFAASLAPSVEANVSEAATSPRTWFDVTFTPVPGTTVDAASILEGDWLIDGEFTLSGAGAEGLAFVSVLQVDATTFRYMFTGTLTPGTVTVTFRAGSWWDSQDNRASAGTSSFRLITQGSSFFIEISGGIRLEAAGLTTEPLIDLKAEVVLEIDTARSLFTLTFAGQLSIYKLGTVGATSGRFVLDMGDGLSSVPQFWGVATLETNFSTLEQYGLKLFAKGTLQINLTGRTKTETLTLRGLGEGGTDLTRTFVLNPYSFGVELVGQAIVTVPGTTTELMRIQGGFFLNIQATPTPALQMYLTGELSFGSGSAQLVYGAATGVLLMSTDLTGGSIPGVAGKFTVSASRGIGLPNMGTLFSASGSVSVMFNTTLRDKTFKIPDAFLPLLHPGEPTEIVIYGAAPGLDGQRRSDAPPGGEVYVKAVIQAQLTIGGVLELNGFIGITAAIDPTGTAYFKVDGAVGTTIPFLGSLTGAVNLAVYVGAKTGVVGRIQLTLGSNSIPGVRFNGQFLLEINTFATSQQIQTFAVNATGGRFGGFVRDAAGNLVVTTQTISVTGGFRLEMGGELVIANTLTVAGHVLLTLSLAGPNPTLELVVNGTIDLAPIGNLTLTDSGFRINADGLVARVSINLAAGGGFGGGVGLGFSATSTLSLNTTGRTQTLGSSTVEAGFLLHIDGSVDFLGIATGFGVLDVRVAPQGFELTFALRFTLGPLVFQASGGAAVYGGTDPGFADAAVDQRRGRRPRVLDQGVGHHAAQHPLRDHHRHRRRELPSRPPGQGLDPQGLHLRRRHALRDRPREPERPGEEGRVVLQRQRGRRLLRAGLTERHDLPQLRRRLRPPARRLHADRVEQLRAPWRLLDRDHLDPRDEPDRVLPLPPLRVGQRAGEGVRRHPPRARHLVQLLVRHPDHRDGRARADRAVGAHRGRPVAVLDQRRRRLHHRVPAVPAADLDGEQRLVRRGPARLERG